MSLVRLGAVNYLNVRPLVFGLDRRHDLVSLRFDPPAECARLLASGAIDLGMVPSITYLDRPDDCIVPDVCIGSDGAVDSVALFLRRPLKDVRTLAVDTSSRTSVALTRILCARRFGISPALVPHPPDLASMLAGADGALLIGDPALYADYRALGAEKIDLGLEWTTMTGLPFVWAFWAGRAGVAPPDVVLALQEAAEQGHVHIETIAAAYAPEPDRQAIARRYLRESLVFRLTPRAIAGLRAYFEAAIELGLATGDPTLRFFPDARERE